MILKTAVLCLAAIAAAAGSECLRVDGDRIRGKDLKAFATGYEQLADAVVLGLTPAAGVRRMLTARELGKRDGSADGAICVERALREVRPEEIEAAMRKALERPQVEIEILDYSRVPLPAGVLEFTLAGLSRPPLLHSGGPVPWRGRVKLEGGRSIMLWARVRVSEQAQWIEAAETLHPGEAVRGEQLAVKSGRQFPLSKPGALTLAEITGRRPRRTIPAGQVLAGWMFQEPPLIQKDELVKVEVVSGAVSLRFEARAETAGRAQERILVLDAAKGQRLQARVTEQGKVVIDAKTHTGAALRGARVAGDSRRVD